MKYTTGKDGVEQVDLNFSQRFTPAELDELNNQAKVLGYESYRAYAEAKIANIQDALLAEMLQALMKI